MSSRDEQYLAYLERHRGFVREAAIELGVPERGRTHDLSKYRSDEFEPYAEYFYGGYERGKQPAEVIAAFDQAWLLHQKRNDHHWQWWVLREDNGATKVLPMSDGARREMLADWIGAGRAILGGEANTRVWFEKNRANILLHPDTLAWIEDRLP